jgi:excisionase family DNA binding protein
MGDDIEILNIEQVAELLGVSVRTVQRHIAANKGRFPGMQIGGKWVFDKRQIIEWVRGEWQPPRRRPTQEELIEKEARRWGADLPGAFIDLQRSAVERAAKREESTYKSTLPDDEVDFTRDVEAKKKEAK